MKDKFEVKEEIMIGEKKQEIKSEKKEEIKSEKEEEIKKEEIKSEKKEEIKSEKKEEIKSEKKEEIKSEKNKNENKALKERIKLKETNLNELDYFRLFFTNEILEQFAMESYIFFKKKLADSYGGDFNEFKETVLGSYGKGNSMPYLFVSRGISKEDILSYIGIKVYMDLHPLADVKSYWNSGTKFINIGTVMSKNYFFLISKAIHFPEKEGEIKEGKNFDTNFKIGPKNQMNLYYSKLCKNYQQYYELGQNATIDESMQHFAGKKKSINLMRQKKESGFKIYLLSDSETGYLYNMYFDPGKNPNEAPPAHKNTNINVSENVVLKLISCLTDKKKRNLFFEEHYSSQNLMKKLNEIDTLSITILGPNSKTKTKTKNNDENESKNGDLIQTTSDDSKNDKLLNNKGVEAFDYDLEILNSDRSSRKWYPKVIFFGVDASMINAKILYEFRTGKSISLYDFKEKVCKLIFKLYREYTKKNTPSDKKNNTQSDKKNIPTDK